MKPVAIIVLCCCLKLVAQAQCSANITLVDTCFKKVTGFRIQTSYPIASVTWDFGDPSAGNTDNTNVIARHQYAHPGTYSVTMYATLGCGNVVSTRTFKIIDCSDTCHATMVVEDSCLKHIIPFTIQSRYPINGLFWNFNDQYSVANISTTLQGNHIFTKKGIYTVLAIVDLACRKDTLLKTISVVDCDTVADESCRLYIPNAFTPNGDGKNEEFKPLTLCNLADYQLWIFNRWGQVVYTTKNIEAGWDGIQKGFKSPAGNYIYMVKYRFAGREPKTAKGSILLLQ